MLAVIDLGSMPSLFEAFKTDSESSVEPRDQARALLAHIGSALRRVAGPRSRLLFLSRGVDDEWSSAVDSAVDLFSISSKTNGTHSNATCKVPTALHFAGSLPHSWLFNTIKRSKTRRAEESTSASATKAPNIETQCLFVHHGGAGSTGVAIRFGIPQVIIPFAFDQGTWAERVEELGVGAAAVLLPEISDEKRDQEEITALREAEFQSAIERALIIASSSAAHVAARQLQVTLKTLEGDLSGDSCTKKGVAPASAARYAALSVLALTIARK